MDSMMNKTNFSKGLIGLLVATICTASQANAFPARSTLEMAASLQFAAVSNTAEHSAVSESILESSSPAKGELNVQPSAEIVLHFAAPLDVNSLTPETVAVMGAEGVVFASINLTENGKTLRVKPGRELNPTALYNVVVNGARDVQGHSLPLVAFGFTTASVSNTPSESASRASADPANYSKAASNSTGASATVVDAALAGDKPDDERWLPTANNRHGKWRTDREIQRPIAKRRNEAMLWHVRSVAEQAKQGRTQGTTVTGVVLRQNDKPLANVKVSIEGIATTTGADGEFSLTGVSPGQKELIVDGRNAGDGKTTQFGYFVIGVDARENQSTPVAPIFLPKILRSDWVSLDSPLTSDTVVRTPLVPGMEIHIPKGAVLRDHEGKLVTQIAIVPMPLDRSPFPFPENAPAYVTVQPGGMVVQGLTAGVTPGIRVHYPNQTDLKPGERVKFWSYNTDSRGWQIYGEGQASDDGAQVVPDAGVALYQSIGFMYTDTNPPPPPDAPPPDDGPGDGPGDGDGSGSGDGGAGDGSNGGGGGGNGGGDNGGGSDHGGDNGGGSDGGGGKGGSGTGGGACSANNSSAGDPVDCKSGLFVLERVDSFVRGVIPITLDRIYRPGDSVSRSFGYGANTGYAMYLREVSGTPGGRYQQFDLILPNGSFVRFYRTSPGSGYTQTVAVHNTSPSSYFASVLDYENGNYVITKKNGTKYIFSLYGTLQSIQDRHGNHLDIAHNSGQIVRITAPSGRYLDFTYDTFGRITQIEDIGGRIWAYAYSSAGYLAKVTYPDGLFEQYTYDASGRMLTLTDRRGTTSITNQYDTNGRVSQQTLADGSVYTFAYTLNATGNVIQTDVTDPRYNVRRVSYDTTGYKSSVMYVPGTLLAQVTIFERDSATGLLTALVDNLGRRTEFHRDVTGNVTQLIRLAGTAGAISDTYTYSADFNRLTSHTNPLGKTTTYAYDTAGNLLTATDPLGHSDTFTHNAAGQLLTITDALNHVVRNSYDPNGDLRSVIDPLGHSVRGYIDVYGRTFGQLDSLGNETRVEFDTMGRITKFIDPAGKVSTITYDGNGNLTSVTDPNGGASQYGYDSRDRQQSRTDALGHSENWTYDGVNNISTYSDREHQQTSHQYDALNRNILTTYADASTLTLTYDAVNNLTQIVDSVSGTITRTYDGLHRLTQEQTPQGIVTYTYDERSRRTTMTPASQLQIQYGYDDANRLISIVQGAETVSLAYDDADRRSSMMLPNGVVTNYSHDDASEVIGITYIRSGTTLANINYSYDATGQRISKTGGFSTEFLPASTSGTNTFDINNRQTYWNGSAVSYDLNGDPQTNGVLTPQTYTFDARHQLKQITQGGIATASFSYDATGRRISKTIGVTTTSFLYDGQNPIQETQGSTVSTILTGLRIDERFARDEPAGRRYFLTDGQGSTLALTDSAGTAQQTYGYEPYGEVVANGSSDNPYQYTGRENDGTGLYYFRKRYYSPTKKRFISEDALGLLAGLNSYSYTQNSPTNDVDPTGKCIVWCTAAVAALGLFIWYKSRYVPVTDLREFHDKTQEGAENLKEYKEDESALIECMTNNCPNGEEIEAKMDQSLSDGLSNLKGAANTGENMSVDHMTDGGLELLHHSATKVCPAH